MWNMQAVSKICELKQQAHSYERHQNTLKKSKPTVDNGNPYQNELSSKLTNKFEGTLSKEKFIQSYKELSHVFKTNKKRNNLNEQVLDQNLKIINRLQSTKSYYERDQQVKEAKKYLTCRDNISQNARRVPILYQQDDSYQLVKISKQKYEH